MNTLGLCVTDIMYPGNSAAKCRINYKKFAAMGIKTVRLTTAWNSPEAGLYTLSASSEDMIKAAIDAGLRLKLTLTNVDEPPLRIFNSEGARYMDETGRLSKKNCVSYWYSGIYDYSADAVNCMLDVLKNKGYLPYVDAVVVCCGTACEPIYPAAWTQDGKEGMWCYADNAQADFCIKMSEKYGIIEAANKAWGTSYTSFDSICVPKPGEATGTLWEDVLIWYRDIKRGFVIKQTAIYADAVNKYSNGRIKLILYIPGEAYTEAEWSASVAGEKNAEGIKIMSENEYIVRLAAEYGAHLQFTGLPDITSVKRVLSYIYDNGYSYIPVYGENVNEGEAASDPAALCRTVAELNLAGIDYTTSQFLFNGDYSTESEEYYALESSLDMLTKHIFSRNPGCIPNQLKSVDARPMGNVLEYTVNAKADSSVITMLSSSALTLKPGDLLEYDVFIPEGVSGIGQIDVRICGALPLSSNAFSSDRYGVRCSETDLRHISGKWTHRIINIAVENYGYDGAGNNVGKCIQSVLLRSTFRCSGMYTAYFGNFIITNGGKVREVLFDGKKVPTEIRDIEATGAYSDWKVTALGKIGK